MYRIDSPQTEKLYVVARQIVDQAFRQDGSIFADGLPIWTVANLADLRKRFVEAPDVSGDSFEAKLLRQLKGAPKEVWQLAAECIYIYLWIVYKKEMGLDRKLELLNLILSQARNPPDLPVDLREALDLGVVRTGIAYHAARNAQFEFVIETGVRLKQLGQVQRNATLSDPWKFKGTRGLNQRQDRGADEIGASPFGVSRDV